MRTNAPSYLQNQLPSFNGADRHRKATLPVRMAAYRLDRSLVVYPIWREKQNG